MTVSTERRQLQLRETIVRDAFDRIDFESASAMLDGLPGTAAALAERSPVAEDLMADMHAAFLRDRPTLRDEVSPSHTRNQVIMREVLEAERFKNLHRSTVGDKIGAGLAVMAMSDLMPDMLDRTEDLQDKADAAQAAAEALEGALGDQPGDQPPPPDVQAMIDQLQAEVDETAAALDAAVDEATPGIGKTIRAALAVADERAEAEAQAAAGWGTGAGELGRMDPSQRIELMRTIDNARMKAIAKQFGQLLNTQFTARDQRYEHGPEEVYDVGFGDDISRLIPAEQMALCIPELEDDFYMRLSEKRVLCYKLRRVIKDDRGAIIYCVDPDTEIMTIDGWKRYTEVAVGDQVLTLNHETGLSEWQPLLAVHVLPAKRRSMLSVETQRHSSLTTLNHRWPVVAYAKKTRERTRAWRTSGTLRTDDLFTIAAPCVSLPTVAKYDDALVELIAWTWTEGTIVRGGSAVRIYQSWRENPGYCADIRRALTDHFGPPCTVDMRTIRSQGIPGWRESQEPNGMTHFHLNKAASEPILAHMNGHKVVAPAFIASLTASQLRLFIARSVDGDGQRKGNVEILGQRHEGRIKTLEMACSLLGLPTTTVAIPETRPGRKPGLVQHITSIHPPAASEIWTYSNSDTRSHVEYDGIVWCPTTPNGTWLARRNGTVYYTGNCEDQSSSMTRGQRDVWSKGFGLSLLGTAKDQRRAFHAICFKEAGSFESFNFECPADFTTSKMIEFASTVADGGTDFETPLDEALRLLEAEHAATGKISADIVFATDGQCAVGDDWLLAFKAAQRRLGFNVYGVAISTGIADSLTKICDGRVMKISDLHSDRDVSSLFTAIA